MVYVLTCCWSLSFDYCWYYYWIRLFRPRKDIEFNFKITRPGKYW